MPTDDRRPRDDSAARLLRKVGIRLVQSLIGIAQPLVRALDLDQPPGQLGLRPAQLACVLAEGLCGTRHIGELVAAGLIDRDVEISRGQGDRRRRELAETHRDVALDQAPADPDRRAERDGREQDERRNRDQALPLRRTAAPRN
ncbi:MAG: hypothetical protein HC871_11505 [Rhizobiales bacterium]|nr:hypothetical protein [Hyphomicrobiales bacterium]